MGGGKIKRLFDKLIRKDPATMIDSALAGIVKMIADLQRAEETASAYIAANDDIIKQKQAENYTHLLAIKRAQSSLAGLEPLLGGS